MIDPNNVCIDADPKGSIRPNKVTRERRAAMSTRRSLHVNEFPAEQGECGMGNVRGLFGRIMERNASAPQRFPMSRRMQSWQAWVNPLILTGVDELVPGN